MSAIGGLQDGGGTTLSGYVAWSPLYMFANSCGVRGVLGTSLFKSALGGVFAVADGQAMFVYNLSSFFIEAGGGAQLWIGQSVFSPMVGGNLGWKPQEKLFGLIDRVVLGYSRLLASTALMHEARVGVGFAF